MTKEQQEQHLTELSDAKVEKTASQKVTPKHTAQDIEGTMSRIDPEVEMSLYCYY